MKPDQLHVTIRRYCYNCRRAEFGTQQIRCDELHARRAQTLILWDVTLRYNGLVVAARAQATSRGGADKSAVKLWAKACVALGLDVRSGQPVGLGTNAPSQPLH